MCNPDKAEEYGCQPQSAVEWNLLCASSWRRIIEQNPGKAVLKAIDLARRCDEAEKQVRAFKANNRYQRGFHDGEQLLRAQLAAAQAEVERLRAQVALLEQNNEVAQKLVHEYHDERERLRADLEKARNDRNRAGLEARKEMMAGVRELQEAQAKHKEGQG